MGAPFDAWETLTFIAGLMHDEKRVGFSWMIDEPPYVYLPEGT